MAKKNKLKVLQVIPELNSGGVERGTIEISRALIEHKYDSYVCSHGGKLVEELDKMGANHIKLPVHSKNPLTIISNIFRLKKIINDNEINVVHARSRAPAWSCFFASKLTGCAFVTTFHGAYSIHHSLKRFYNSVMLRSDKIIAVSNFIKKHIETRYHHVDDNLVVIQRGVDLDYFNPKSVTQERKNAIKQKLGLEDNANKLIIMPARFTRLKGHLFLINALSYIKKLDFKCLLVGNISDKHADYNREIQLLIKEMGLENKVLIKPAVDDMAALYSICDLVVSSSQEPEAFGRTVPEAQAMGKIVIATNIGGPAELIEDGVTGYLVSPNCPSDFAGVIKHALTLNKTEAAAITKKAMQEVKSKYSLKKMCEATLAVYNEVA